MDSWLLSLPYIIIITIGYTISRPNITVSIASTAKVAVSVQVRMYVVICTFLTLISLGDGWCYVVSWYSTHHCIL